jgi:hypothetical protein
VVADGEAQLVAPDRQRPPPISGWSVRPSAFVIAAVNTNERFAGELVKLDGDADRRTAGMGIEHMGAEPAVDLRHALARHLACDAQSRDVEDFLQRGGELGRAIVRQRRSNCARIESRVWRRTQTMKGKPNFAL